MEADEGETLATQGDLGHAMFAIESGTVEVSANGRRLATLGAGDVFGEVAVLAAGIRMAMVVATSRVRLIALLKRDVWARRWRPSWATTAVTSSRRSGQASRQGRGSACRRFGSR